MNLNSQRFFKTGLSTFSALSTVRIPVSKIISGYDRSQSVKGWAMNGFFRFISLCLFICFLVSVACYECHASQQFPRYRAVHMGGNWGVTSDIVALPQDYFLFLKNLNVDWVGISVALHYDDSMDSTVERKYSGVSIPTFTDEVLINLIRKFKEYGFRVYLTLAFEAGEAASAEHPVSRWQLGDPNMPSEDPNISEAYWPWSLSHALHDQFVAEFWDTYTQQAVYFATIAQQEGVELFSLGTETERLFRTRSGGYWPNDFKNELSAMVAAVRSVYDGSLTYDMSSDAMRYENFYGPGSNYLWEDLGLDVVGVSAYFQLSQSSPATVMDIESLEEKWEEVFNDYLIPLKDRNPNLPILFLEFGYCDSVQAPYLPSSEEFTTRVFTDSNENGIDDGAETQANIYEAFFSSIDNHPDVIQGAFLWGHSMISEQNWENYWSSIREFSVRGKVAEEIVRATYDKWADGDMNTDGLVDLKDAVLVLKVLSDNCELTFQQITDVGGDGRPGIEDAIYIMQDIAAQR